MRSRALCWRVLPVLTIVLLGLPRLAAAPPDAAPVDAIVADALKYWKAPGMAVAVVHNDEVIYCKGAGVRKVGGNDAVTADTIFGIGSLTKAFTATTIAMLIDDGKMNWDDPVRKHVPYFHLSDPLADRDVTLRDLLCHRTGLSRHELLWYRAPWTVEESVKRLAAVEPSASFRAKYQYNNLAYLAAGLACNSAAKKPWHELVTERLFDPLGMKGAVFTKSAAEKADDHATPHRRTPADKIVVMPWYDDDNQIRASGSIKAGARDLSNWLRFQLGNGTVDGKRLVSATNLAETHTPQIVEPLEAHLAKITEATQRSYGLGWHITDYRGHKLLDHGGAVDGFRARILLLPKDKMGVVILTNVEETAVVNAAGNNLLDHLLKLEKKDWNDFFAQERKKAEEASKAGLERQAAKRMKGTKPSHTPADYAGEYEDAAYGRLKITANDGKLTLTWSNFKVRLEHFHYDTFAINEDKEEDDSRLNSEQATFALGTDGEVASVRFLGRVFARVKAK